LPLNSTHYAMLYPQNGDRIVAIDSVTSLHPMYKQHKNYIIRNSIVHYFTLPLVEYCDERVCLSRQRHISLEPQQHVQTSPNFLCTSPIPVTQSFCGSIAVSYVLPVLWTTSCLHIAARNMRHKNVYSVSCQAASQI